MIPKLLNQIIWLWNIRISEKRKDFIYTKVFTEKRFVSLLNIRGLVTNILDFTGDSRLLHVPLICLTESHLLPSSNLSGIPTTYQIIRNNDEIDKHSSNL